VNFITGDLVRVRHVLWGRRLILGIVIDVDPAESAPSYYLISVEGNSPDWYHEDEVYSVQEA